MFTSKLIYKLYALIIGMTLVLSVGAVTHAKNTLPTFADYQVFGVTSGANFAGHYRIEESGCGTECRVLKITDLHTGQVVHQKGYGSSGVEYHPDSELLLLNPFNSHYNKIGSSHHKVKKFFRWNGTNLEFLAEEDWSESA